MGFASAFKRTFKKVGKNISNFASSVKDKVSDFGNDVADVLNIREYTDAASPFSHSSNNFFNGKYGIFSHPDNLIELIRNGKTNEVNQKIAEQNLKYQQDYNQKIWDREDTTYQRTLADMSQAGMSGLAMSSVDGVGGQSSAPQNSFQYTDHGVLKDLAEVANVVGTLGSLKNSLALGAAQVDNIKADTAFKLGSNPLRIEAMIEDNAFKKWSNNYYKQRGFPSGSMTPFDFANGIAQIVNSIKTGSSNPVIDTAKSLVDTGSKKSDNIVDRFLNSLTEKVTGLTRESKYVSNIFKDVPKGDKSAKNAYSRLMKDKRKERRGN